MEPNQKSATSCEAYPASICSKSESDTPRTLIQVKEADGYCTETEAMAHMVDFCKQLERELGEVVSMLLVAVEIAGKNDDRWQDIDSDKYIELLHYVESHSLNPSHHAEPPLGGDSVDGVVGTLNQEDGK